MNASVHSSVAPLRRSRWYVPTPAKFLFALLVMQGVLFLSAQYRWFWFNERKGYTVLITVGATAIALLLLIVAAGGSRFFKARMQFGLATLFLIVPVMAIPCGWLAREMDHARLQGELVKSSGVQYPYAQLTFVSKRSGKCEFFDDSNGISDEWFSSAFGPNFFHDLRCLTLGGSEVTDRDIASLREFRHVEYLSLYNAPITDAGLEHLKRFTELQVLYLNGTQVTDAGLEHLKGLTKLQRVDLRETQVTAAGIDQLKVALPNCEVVR